MPDQPPSFTRLSWALVGVQILMAFSLVGLAVYFHGVAKSARQAEQWPPPGTRMVKWRAPVTGDGARRMAAAGGYLLSLAFRYAKLFRLW